jgi:FMN phosphatase YigB (HAD superfamily)
MVPRHTDDTMRSDEPSLSLGMTTCLVVAKVAIVVERRATKEADTGEEEDKHSFRR